MKLPYYHQKNCYFCGPTSLKMVFENFGIRKTEDEIARLAGTRKERGTTHQGMIEACRMCGCSCFVHENANMANVKAFLKAKLPVIIDWIDSKSDDGHYSVITSVKGDKIFFSDPWYGPGYGIDRKTFEEYWHDRLTGGCRWVMVVLPDHIKVKYEIMIKAGNNDIVVKAGRIYTPE